LRRLEQRLRLRHARPAVSLGRGARHRIAEHRELRQVHGARAVHKLQAHLESGVARSRAAVEQLPGSGFGVEARRPRRLAAGRELAHKLSDDALRNRAISLYLGDALERIIELQRGAGITRTARAGARDAGRTWNITRGSGGQ
jgi:hypothetical protein